MTKWNKQKSRKQYRRKNKKSKRNTKFKKLKNTWHDKYKINVIGIPSEIDDFVKYCDKNNIYRSKPQIFTTNNNKKYKMVLFNKKAQRKIEMIAEDYNKIIINADIITAKRVL